MKKLKFIIELIYEIDGEKVNGPISDFHVKEDILIKIQDKLPFISAMGGNHTLYLKRSEVLNMREEKQ